MWNFLYSSFFYCLLFYCLVPSRRAWHHRLGMPPFRYLLTMIKSCSFVIFNVPDCIFYCILMLYKGLLEKKKENYFHKAMILNLYVYFIKPEYVKFSREVRVIKGILSKVERFQRKLLK